MACVSVSRNKEKAGGGISCRRAGEINSYLGVSRRLMKKSKMAQNFQPGGLGTAATIYEYYGEQDEFFSLLTEERE